MPPLKTLIANLNDEYPLPTVAAGFRGTSFDRLVIRADEDGDVPKVFMIAGTAYDAKKGDIWLDRHTVEDYTDEDDSWGDLADAIKRAVD
jgi:hypothetical protein